MPNPNVDRAQAPTKKTAKKASKKKAAKK